MTRDTLRGHEDWSIRLRSGVFLRVVRHLRLNYGERRAQSDAEQGKLSRHACRSPSKAQAQRDQRDGKNEWRAQEEDGKRHAKTLQTGRPAGSSVRCID